MIALKFFLLLGIVSSIAFMFQTATGRITNRTLWGDLSFNQRCLALAIIVAAAGAIGCLIVRVSV